MMQRSGGRAKPASSTRRRWGKLTRAFWPGFMPPLARRKPSAMTRMVAMSASSTLAVRAVPEVRKSSS